MPDPRLVKYADVLVNYSTKVKPGDWVHIYCGRPGAPLVREIVDQVMLAGGHATYFLDSDGVNEALYKNATIEQAGWCSPLDMLMVKQADVAMFLNAPENTRSLTATDPKKQQAHGKAYTKWHEIYMKRSAEGSLRWTMANFATPALAQEADMSLADYEDFLYKATFIDQPDPVKAWKKVHDEQEKLVKALEGKKEFRIRGVNADVVMSIEGRRFINSDGDQNMPSGEVFTSPVENSVNGWVNFTYPAVHLGREVEGVRLEFKGGRVVKASATKNEEFLINMLDLDKGARVVGELGLGTNYGISRFTKDILFDEKIGGSFHLAVGSGFAECGGKNHSGLHWDFICDARADTEMLVDGKLFYRDGKFLRV
jgi:aminopeptidase